MSIQQIPITKLVLGEEEERLVLEVIRSGQLASGPKVAELERVFAEAHEVKHAVAVNNGTTALIAAVEVLNLQPGDEVVTSPFTFVATLNAILAAGATARFADIGDDFCIDGSKVEAAITDRTKVIMPVHLYGQAADMDPISLAAESVGASIIEDAAQAHLAGYKGRPVGAWGQATFSLYATKNLMCGEGGLITTNDDGIADRLRLLRNQGMRQRYQYEMAGNNYRLTDLQAAVALGQWGRLAASTAARQTNAGLLTDGLDGIEGFIAPRAESDRHHVWHQYTVRVLPEAKLSRDELLAALAEQGIGCGVYYPKVVFDYDCYRTHPDVIADDVPHAFAIAQQVISLPVHPYLTGSEIDRIVTTIRGLLGAN